MRPLTWTLKEVDTINFIIMSGIAPKQNAFKFKIEPHKHKYDLCTGIATK
jgi:hypothetical protein